MKHFLGFHTAENKERKVIIIIVNRWNIQAKAKLLAIQHKLSIPEQGISTR